MIVALDTLKPHKRNYNKHPDHQVKRLAAALRKFKQRKPITTWRNTVLTGHGVFLAAQQLGWTEIDIAPCPDEWTEGMALAWLAADNELARLADPDLAQLAEIIEEARNHDSELLEAIGFDEAEFAALLDKIAVPDFREYDESAADEVEAKRIGSFADPFVFEGEYKEAWARIGNSVPPLFMRSIAQHIRREILG